MVGVLLLFMLQLMEKKAFEKLLETESKHIKWIIKENLKKNRLIKMDTDWVKKMEKRLTPAST